MSKRFQNHFLNLDITIKEVFIKSKSSGTLSFEIRSDRGSVNLKNKIYTLQNQHCVVYEHAQLQLENQFDTIAQTYKSKQITIYVNLELDRGSSVGGYVRFNPLEATFNEKQWQLPLQNCPPNSKMLLSSKLDFISKKQHTYTKQSNSNDYEKIKQKNTQRQHKKSSAINQLIKADQKFNPREPIKSYKNFEKEKYNNKTKKIENAKSAPYQKRFTGLAKAHSPKLNEEYQQKNKFNEQMQKLKQKIQEQRVQKVRSISKLRMEISPKLLIGQGVQNDTQLSRLRQKIRHLQRKQKNYQINIDDLNNELQKNKAKFNNLSKIKEDIEKNLSDKQIKLKNALSTIKQLNDQIDSYTSRERVVSKKGEVKQNILKDQTKRLQQKLKISQEEINLAVKEKNDIIKNMVELQNKHQTVLKEKDNKLNEEKNKCLRHRQEWTKLQRQLLLKIQQLNDKIQVEERRYNTMSQRCHQLEMIVLKYENDTVQLKENLKREKDNTSNLQEKHQQSAGQELISLRKRYNELHLESVSNKQKIRRYESQKVDYQNRLKQLQEKLKVKNDQNQKHLSRINRIQKDLDSSLEDNNRKGKQIEYLKQSIANLNNKTGQLREKAELQKSRRQESNNDLQKHLSFFNKQKEILQTQISEYKWTIIRNNDKISELQQKIKSGYEQTLKLNEQIMAKGQRIISLEQNNKMLALQNQNLIKEKNQSAFKFKENLQIIKAKQNELDQQKKMRLKAQQKCQQQKVRANQLELSNKNREIHDQKRQKEKQQLIKNLNQELENRQLQIFKKNEEFLILKASCEMSLREIELTKMENQNIKNEVNLVHAANNQLKEQNASIKIKNEDLDAQLLSNKQRVIIQGKKIDSLKQQFDQYKQGVKNSLENLVKQFYKQELNWNIIATTLIPFPDQNLSSLQIQLVQKRNNFMVKQRQITADLQAQVASFEKQINDLKNIFEQRQAEMIKDQTSEKQKLKSLLYEGMVQKNQVVQDLNHLINEKEQLQRQVQKLKGQVIKRIDNEQELNGQLQMLLLQYDGLKSQNQDLSGLIFKYRQQQIKNKGQHDQKLIQTQDQHNRYVQKIKLQNMQKQRKIISLEKDLIQSTQKYKKIQSERNQYRDQGENNNDTIKQLDNQILSLNTEITKLNNIIKTNEKKQYQMRDIIQKQENQIRHLKNKQEINHTNYKALETDLMQSIVENQKLKAENANAVSRLQQTSKILHEKGQVSKQKIQKKMEENSQLKTKLFQKQSELSIKDFHLKQKQQQIAALLQQKQEQKNIIINLKNKIKELNQIKQINQLNLKQLGKQLQSLEKQRLKNDEILTKSNYAIFSMENELVNMRNLEQIIRQKENECVKLREDKNETEQHYIQEIKSYRQAMANLRKELENEKNYQNNLKKQHQSKLQKSQSNNCQKYNFLIFQLQKQRQDFSKRVEQIEQHNNKIVVDLENRFERARQQYEQAKQNQKLLEEQIRKKDSLLSSLRRKIQALQIALDQIKQKYNKYYNLYEQAKANLQQQQREHEQRLIASIKNCKVSQLKNLNHKFSQINRKIQKLRQSQEFDLKLEPMNRRQVSLILQRIFNKIESYITQSESNEISDSFQVKKRSEYIYQ